MTGDARLANRTDVRQRPLRILLLTQFYAPEIGAPQTRLRETVRALTARGHLVTVVTATPSYPRGIVSPGYHWWKPQREYMDGVEVLHLPTAVLRGTDMKTRLLAHASFAASSLATLGRAQGTDVALFESPPLLLAIPARILRAFGVPYVFHVADPWPDFPIALGYLRSPSTRRLAFALEDMAYGGAAAVTTVSEGLVELLDSKRSARGRVTLIPNGVDTTRFAQLPSRDEARRRLGWKEGFTIVYVGTVGRAQGIATLLEAARLVGDEVTVRIVGDGAERLQLQERATRTGLGNVHFVGSVPAADVPLVLAAADAGLVMLRKGRLYEHSLPTKLLETMAAARPVIVSADGLARTIVDAADGGYTAPAEDAAALAAAISLARADEGRSGRGIAGRAFVRTNYEREAIVDRLTTVLECAAQSRRGAPQSARARRPFRPTPVAPTVEFGASAPRTINRAKRLLDVLGAAVGLLVAAPIIGGAAVGTRLSGDRGPLFYRATRVGEGGRPIRVVKLRTMRAGAGGPAVTGRMDPRVTPFGRTLRRLKIDELPQLWNVLRGDMSLVGPRPEDARYVDWSDPVHGRVFGARPGITGLAQLEYPHEEELLAGDDADHVYRSTILPEKVKLDAYYLDHASIGLDLLILVRTAGAVLRSPRRSTPNARRGELEGGRDVG